MSNTQKIFDARNFIISGTPGCGKSHFINKYAVKEIIGDEKDYNIYVRRITFTEGLTHEDFFGCYKPTMDEITTTRNNVTYTEMKLSYNFSPGIFCEILSKAIKDEDNNYVLIIEELNRGHIYEIFGNVFQLLDRTEEFYSEYPVAMPDDCKRWFRDSISDERFNELFQNSPYLEIPENLFIICTMNNADQRVQLLDTAFKRRFSFAYMDTEGTIFAPINFPGVEKYRSDNKIYNVSSLDNFIDNNVYNDIRKEINRTLSRKDISEDKLISKYFINKEKITYYDFIVTIIGYLFQNIFRANPMLRDEILNKKLTKDKRDLSSILSYCSSLDEDEIFISLFNESIYNQDKFSTENSDE